MANLLAIRNDFVRQEADWESTFAKCVKDLDGIELRISMLPPLTMEEVVTIMSRFIEHNAAQEDRDAFP